MIERALLHQNGIFFDQLFWCLYKKRCYFLHGEGGEGVGSVSFVLVVYLFSNL